MKKVGVVILIVSHYVAYASAPAKIAMPLTDKEQVIAKQEYDDLMEIYSPSKEDCSAQGRLIGYDSTVESSMACMVAEFKNVFYGEACDVEEFNNLSAELKILLKAQQIDSLILTDEDNKHFVLFTPAGKINALLLLKHFDEFEKGDMINDYLMGHLLGYTEDEIVNYYNKNKKKQKFDVEKQEAFNWIEKNIQNIESWIQEKINDGDIASSV